MSDDKKEDSPKGGEKNVIEIKICKPPTTPQNVTLTLGHHATGMLRPSKPKIVTEVNRGDE